MVRLGHVECLHGEMSARRIYYDATVDGEEVEDARRRLDTIKLILICKNIRMYVYSVITRGRMKQFQLNSIHRRREKKGR